MDFPFVKEAISQLFSKSSCAMYPAVPSQAAPGYRGRIVYHADKCIACGAVHPDHGKAGHEHVYKQGKCVTCGAIDPSHTTHTYVNGVCSVCEVVCEHKFDETTKVCSVCGGQGCNLFKR